MEIINKAFAEPLKVIACVQNKYGTYDYLLTSTKQTIIAYGYDEVLQTWDRGEYYEEMTYAEAVKLWKRHLREHKYYYEGE